MAASYPKSLRYFLSAIDVTKQTYKKTVESPAGQTAGPNDTIIWSYPSTYVNMDSVHVQANLDTSAASPSNYVRLSKNTEALIQQFQTETNGTVFDNGVRYTNVLLDAMHDYQVDQNKTPMRSVLQNDYTASPVAASNVHVAQPIIISTFPGFVGTCQPRILPCDVLPLKNYLRLADTKCLITDAPASATYTLSKINVVYETIAINDGGLFDATLRDGLLQAPLEIPFDLWRLTTPGQQNIDNTVLAQANTESLDLMLGLVLDPLSVSAPNAYDAVTGKAQYFKRGWGSDGALEYSWMTVQGVPYPAWRPNPAETFAQTQFNFGKLNDTFGGSAAWLKAGDNVTGQAVLGAYLHSGYAALTTFTYPNMDEVKEMRLRSGLNVSGSTSGCEWTTTGTTGSAGMPVKLLFTKQTSILLVGAGQQVQLRA